MENEIIADRKKKLEEIQNKLINVRKDIADLEKSRRLRIVFVGYLPLVGLVFLVAGIVYLVFKLIF